MTAGTLRSVAVSPPKAAGDDAAPVGSGSGERDAGRVSGGRQADFGTGGGCQSPSGEELLAHFR